MADIDIVKNELYFFLRFINSLNQEHKEKVYECISFLLRLKRFLISDKSYVDSKMESHKFELDFENGYIEEIKNKVLKNKFALYSVSNIDFNKAIYSAIETYAKYPIQSLIPTYNINSDRQVYSIGVEKNIKGNNNFEKYINEKGKEYTVKHPELLNKIQEDYYEEFLKYLSKIFIMQQNLVISILGNKDFKKIMDELTEEIKHNIKNDYCIIVGNILFIETNIIKILEKNNLSDLNDGFKNINQLFEVYKDDERITNGLMYLNYVLYEKSGLNLRNNAMHGTLINEDLSVPLLVSYSGLIFVSWLLNAK